VTKPVAHPKKRGRKSKYGQHDPVTIASVLGRLGGTDVQLCEALGIDRKSLHVWKQANPELIHTLKSAKEKADAEVEKSLFQRALGYTHPEIHISNYKGEITKTKVVKHYPPSEVACIFWLKNRRPDLWRDVSRHEVTGKDGGPVQVEQMNSAQLEAELIARGEVPWLPVLKRS
jgi:hypothetical protein